MKWITNTLKLNCNLYVITESRFIDFIKSVRPREYLDKTIYFAETKKKYLVDTLEKVKEENEDYFKQKKESVHE
jgi:hypothetical protein